MASITALPQAGHVRWNPQRTMIVARRVLKQLARDRRFLGLSIIAPLFIIYLLKIFFDSLGNFGPSRYIVPAGALIVHFLTYILCSIVLVRERKAQTLQLMFISGFRRGEIIMGYLAAYTILATLQTLIVLFELAWVFNLDYNLGTQLSIYLVIWLLAVISIALGVFLSNFSENEGQMLPTIPMVIFPSVFLSGFLIQVDKLPLWAQYLSWLTPLYYANNILQTIIKPGKGLGDELPSLLGLLIYGILVLTLATFTLREQE
ncbi:MAG TPA: ABC transporter permease [Chloroflexia bacterium]|nr:ABC transporter permease [Chloroflexia bacterium]